MKYLISLAALFSIVTIAVMSLTNIGIETDFLFPANHTENIIRQVKPILEASSEVTKEMIPQGCRFTVFDKSFNAVKTNMNEKNLSEATLYAKGYLQQSSETKRYYFIERQDGYCVLQYYVQLSYGSDWLNDNFPKPEFFVVVIFVLGCFFSIAFITVIFAKNLKSNLDPLLEATEKIKEQDLNFDVGISKIKEFNNILLSLSDMKTELKKSLEKQWNLEQSKREQVSSLAHDIKTPLTIVKGNAELLEGTCLDDEQRGYIKFILKNANQIEQYVILLNRISKIESELSFSLNKVNTEEFILEVCSELTALAISKQIKIECLDENLPKELTLDKDLFFRCLMNVISNAVDYTPNEGLIKLCIASDNSTISFTIIDNGKGFTKEALKFATKQFYMGDMSRSSAKHFGMGLYIADSIAKKHGGELILENSSDTGGGKVTIEIPLLKEANGNI